MLVLVEAIVLSIVATLKIILRSRRGIGIAMNLTRALPPDEGDQEAEQPDFENSKITKGLN